MTLKRLTSLLFTVFFASASHAQKEHNSTNINPKPQGKALPLIVSAVLNAPAPLKNEFEVKSKGFLGLNNQNDALKKALDSCENYLEEKLHGDYWTDVKGRDWNITCSASLENCSVDGIEATCKVYLKKHPVKKATTLPGETIGLYVLDGTDTTLDMASNPGRYYKEFLHHEDRSKTATYFEGGTLLNIVNNSDIQVDRIYSHICDRVRGDPKHVPTLTGYSRGGAWALLVAHKLNEPGCCMEHHKGALGMLCKRWQKHIKVGALVLFDTSHAGVSPGDLLGLTWPKDIPSNVQEAIHFRRTSVDSSNAPATAIVKKRSDSKFLEGIITQSQVRRSKDNLQTRFRTVDIFTDIIEYQDGTVRVQQSRHGDVGHSVESHALGLNLLRRLGFEFK